MRGWILYFKNHDRVGEKDYGVSRMLEAAAARGIDLKVFSPEQFELIVTHEDHKTVLVDGKPMPIPDFLIPRLGSSTTYFALAIIRQLERLGVYVCNSSSTIETVKDKLHMHQLLANSKLPTPKTMLLKFPVNYEVVKKEIGFPVVVKNITGTEGNGIYLCQSEDKFTDLMELIYTNNSNANIILQEFIEFSSGRDLRVFVVGGKIIGCMQRISKTGFKANFSRGGTVEPFVVSEEVARLATQTAKLVSLDIAGIDLLFDANGGYKVCEANSSPGFKGLEQVMGRNIAEHIIDFIISKVNSKSI
jgi:gamma-F420-2:alpha-L-glutamate ligase